MDLKDPVSTFSIRPLTIVLLGDQVGDFAKINVFSGFEALFQLLRACTDCKECESTQIVLYSTRSYPYFDRMTNPAWFRQLSGGKTAVFYFPPNQNLEGAPPPSESQQIPVSFRVDFWLPEVSQIYQIHLS